MPFSKSDSTQHVHKGRARSPSPEDKVLFKGRSKPACTAARPPQQPSLTDNLSLSGPAAATKIFTASATSSSVSSQPTAQNSIFLFSPQATPFSPQHDRFDGSDKIGFAQPLELRREHPIQPQPQPHVANDQRSDVDENLLARFRAQIQRHIAKAPASIEHSKDETPAASSQSRNCHEEENNQSPRKQPRYILLKEKELKQQQSDDLSPTYTWARISPFDKQVLPLDAPWEPDLTRPPKSSPKASWSNPAKSTHSTHSKASPSSSAQRTQQRTPSSEGEDDDDGPMTWETLPRTEDVPIDMPFGKKMLEKNGWKEGEGLGKRGEGRSKALDLRSSGQARGYGERGGVGS